MTDQTSGSKPGSTEPPAPEVSRADTPPPAPKQPLPKEIGGPPGPEPTRYGDWQYNGRVTDF
jgi:hypothetical protein